MELDGFKELCVYLKFICFILMEMIKGADGAFNVTSNHGENESENDGRHKGRRNPVNVGFVGGNSGRCSEIQKAAKV